MSQVNKEPVDIPDNSVKNIVNEKTRDSMLVFGNVPVSVFVLFDDIHFTEQHRTSVSLPEVDFRTMREFR